MKLIFRSFYVFEGIFFIYQDKSTFYEQDLSHVITKILVNLHNTAKYFFLKWRCLGCLRDFFVLT